MAIRRLNKDLYSHLNTQLGLTGDRADEPLGIRELHELLIATRDSEGTRLLDTNIAAGQFTSAAGVSFIESGDVPSDTIWLVHACSVYHSSGSSLRLSIHIRAGAAGVFSAIAGNESGIPGTERLAVPRPFAIPEGIRIRGEVVSGVGAGNTVTLEFLYHQLSRGEYILLP